MTRRWLLALSGIALIGRTRLKAGCRVSIVAGPLDGFIGKYLGHDGEKHAVEIRLINRPMLVRLDGGSIERCVS